MLALSCVRAAEPKRVLVVHSFGSVAPPFTTHSTAFEAGLVKKMGNRVDLDEVSLDMARYASPDMQDALVEYLEKRGRQWRPDLVVPIGGPAGMFVAKYRQRLFAQMPVLYCSLDRRLLGPDALDQNTTYVGSTYEVAGFAEDILQIAPDTKNIAVVIGATPLERYWAEEFRKGFEPFTNRVNFIWLNDLSFDQMLDRVRNLPPHSFIFLILFLRDAAGVTQNADEALQRLHAVANAPINSIFTSQMGLGIVGGRLYPSTEDGLHAADIAVQILNGEPPSSFPPKIVPPSSPRYDWRELQRWRIDQKKLPPGSTILFRSPTIWEQYWAWIISGIAIFLIETLLLAALVANLVRRRRAERSLAESEARFRIAADAAPVLMWMSGPDKLCTFFNKAWLEFTGRPMEEQLGECWSEGVHPDDLDECLATYTRAFDAREPFTMQYRLRRYDGEYRCINDEGIPRFDSKGQFIGYVGACVDVSDLLQKERELNESEERVTLAAEAAHLGVWELDVATSKIWLSDPARKLFQFEPEEEITYSILSDRVHPEDRALREEAIRRAIDTQSRYEIEYRILLPDQTERWVAGRGHYLSNPETRGGRLLGVSMDVTERKQAEQLFQLAAEGSHLGVWDWDETTGKLKFDGAMREIFDIPREGEMTLDAAYRAIHPPDLERVKQVWRQAVETGLPYQHEYRVRRSNGAIGWVHARGRGYYDDKGKPLRMIGIVLDITDRKQAEEEARRRSEQINLLGRASLLGEMTASIAHEVNQPLSSIMSNAGAGQRFIDRGNVDLATLREILVDVETDAHRAYEIIRNIRDTMKKGATVRRPIDANAIVTQVTHMLQPDASARSVELTTSLARDLPMVTADPIQIQQVLVNLLSNALDAMHETPLEQREMQVATTRNGDGTICVSVRDRGGGIAPEIRKQLFDQFFTTKEKGLGMGLSIVRSIVEAHGGKVEAENDDGGARFSFTLPID
jgi:PAS domain S-box-containing protein